MTHKDFLRYLTFTFKMSSLRDGLHVLCGTWRVVRNALKWAERRTRSPAKLGSASAGGCVLPATTFHGALRGRTIPRRRALPCTPKTAHSAPRPTAVFRFIYCALQFYGFNQDFLV